MSPTPEQCADRVRAAIAHSGHTNRHVAHALQVSPSVVDRMSSKTSPRGATLDELNRVADATGTPRPFMRHGFEPFDLLVFDEAGNPIAILEAKDSTTVRAHTGSGKTQAAALYLAAAFQLLLSGEDDDPALSAGSGPLPELPELPFGSLPSSEAAEPTPGSEPSPPGREGHPRAEGRREVW